MSETNATPFKVTAQDVISGLYDLAAERPGVYENVGDSKYAGCVNVEYKDGEKVPSCIVGSYLAARVGVENVPESGAYYSTLRRLEEQGLITVEPEAEFILGVAQLLQDTRKAPWSAISDAASGMLETAESFRHKKNEQLGSEA